MDSIAEELKNLIEKNTHESNIDAKKIILQNKDKLYEISYHHGENLLHWCGAYDNYDICEYLINDMHFITNISNSRSTTPLYYAATKNSINTIKILLKYHADIRSRSGFSGMFPHQICNDEVKNIIIEYEKNIPLDYENSLAVKEGYTLVQAYNYRLCKFYVMILSSSFLTINNRYNISKIDEKIPLKILNENTFYQIKEMYENALKNYIDNLNNSETKFCLNCKTIDNLKRCSQCKKIYFCSIECQKKCHSLHKYDCKP
jgi:ankyrin repeat protein